MWGNGLELAAVYDSVRPPATLPADAPQSRTGTGKERILVVEDQDEVRKVATAILRRSGFGVMDAALPHEALAMIRDRHTHFDLMLTDVVMPEMSGRELARVVAELRPEIRVLYMSGYAEAAIVENGVIEPGLAFIAKPFTPKALVQAVRATLDCR